MNALAEIKQNLVELRYQAASLRVEINFNKLMWALKAGFNREQPRDERGRWTSEGGIQVTTYDGFLTGIPTIDNTSEALSNILTRTMEILEYLPEMSPSKHGTAVHVAFGLAVKVANLPGVGDIERSFSLEDSDPQYGLLGTIRTDVTFAKSSRGDHRNL